MKPIQKKFADVFVAATRGLPVHQDVVWKARNQNTRLVIERVSETRYSIACYGEQNGDAMRDPEIMVLHAAGQFYPYAYRNDYIGTDRTYVYFDAADDVPTRWNKSMQYDLAGFFGTWFPELKHLYGFGDVAGARRVDPTEIIHAF